MKRPSVLAIVGPTASGKSDLALALARQLDGELVCMDSMQIYRRMDIGTAKPTAEERASVPHHMLDIIEPTESYAVADYAVDAEKVIREIISRNKLPILVGGTGLYLKALMHGLTLGGAGSDDALRAQLNAQALEPDGKEALHRKLEAVDPVSAQKFHPNDIRRVIRALEVFSLTGVPISQQAAQEAQGPFEVLPLAIELPRNVLYERLERRVHLMMQAGLLGEVKALLRDGVTADMQSMQGIGYKELIPVAEERMKLDDAVWQIILNTRHYAKRQATWLRTEPKTVWMAETGEERLQRALQLAMSWKGTMKE